jgi:hypothetical protein
MKSRNLVILAVVVAALGGYIFFHERHQLTTDERRERADKVFPTLERDDVRTVEIDNAHGRFVMAKAGDEWRLLEPIDYPADSGAVNAVLTSLEGLESERILGTDEVELAAYGLDSPEITVRLETADGISHELAVGSEAALGSNRAFRPGGGDQIILGRGWFVTDLDKNLDDWRSRNVVTISSGDVASLQLVAGDDRVQVIRDGRTWKLIEPLEDMADVSHVDALITDLAGLRVEEFLEAGADTAELGLEPPAQTVTLLRNDESDPIRLEFGASRDEGGTTRVACRRDGADLFWVNDKAATRLARAPVRWRATKVWDFDTWDAERLTLSTGGSSVALHRAEGLWASADDAEVDHGEVQDRLSKLSALEVVEYDLIQPGTEPLGTVELGLTADDDAEAPTVTYTFYSPMAEGGDAMVTVSGRATVMSVSADSIAEILAEPGALLEPQQTAGDASQASD